MIELAEDDVRTVQPQFERFGRRDTLWAGLIFVSQQELAGLQRTPGPVRLLLAVAWIHRRVRALDRRLRDRIGKAEMLAFRADSVFMRQCHGVLHESDLDSANRVHFVTDDPCRFFAPLIGIGANPAHGMNVRASEAALPVLRRMLSDIADHLRTAPHSRAERIGEAGERPLRETDRLQALVGESDVYGEAPAVFFLPRIDAVAQIAQPLARLCAVGELYEDVAPVAHEDGRDHVVLDIVKLVLQFSGKQTPLRSSSAHGRAPPCPIAYAAFRTPRRSGTSVNCRSLPTSVSMSAPLRTCS